MDAARTLLSSAQKIFSELGSAVGLGESSVSAGMVELMAANLPEASRELESAHARFTALGVVAGAGIAAAWLAETLYRQGGWDGAQRWAAVAEETGGAGSRDGVIWLGVQAKLAARSGDLAAAEVRARSAIDLVDHTDALVDRADALLNLAEVLRLGGREAEAHEVGGVAASLYDAKGHVIGSARASSRR